MKYARLVWRNLSRNVRRTTLTIFAIALAVFTYSTMASLPYLVSHLVSSPTSERRLVAMNKSGFFYPLPAAYRQKIEAIPHIEAVSALTYFGGIYRSPSDQIGIAVDADAAGTLWPDWGIARERAALFQRTRTGCLVSPAMMHKYGWKIGEHIILKGTVYSTDVSLVIADQLGDGAPPDTLLFRRDYLDEVLGAGARVNAYYAIADRKQDVPAAIASIDETFANSSAETYSASEASWVSSFFDLRTLLLILSTVAGAVVFAMSLVALNTMVMAMRERRGEIAVMRVLGFGPSLIVALTLTESTAIGLAGGIAGCAAAFAMAKLIPGSMLPLGPVDLFAILPPAVLARAMALAVLIGVVAGSIPAANFARRGIVESIRAVG
ncbi:MAG: ABC transporter permease [Candidatus Binatus sp.]